MEELIRDLAAGHYGSGGYASLASMVAAALGWTLLTVLGVRKLVKGKPINPAVQRIVDSLRNEPRRWEYRDGGKVLSKGNVVIFSSWVEGWVGGGNRSPYLALNGVQVGGIEIRCSLTKREQKAIKKAVLELRNAEGSKSATDQQARCMDALARADLSPRQRQAPECWSMGEAANTGHGIYLHSDHKDGDKGPPF